MEPPAKKPQRSWTREEETLLLQHYFRARNDASLRSDKGIKSKAWTLIITRIAEDGVVADKDQCRSKYSRLMSEYDVYKRLCDLDRHLSPLNASTSLLCCCASVGTCAARAAATWKRSMVKGGDPKVLSKMGPTAVRFELTGYKDTVISPKDCLKSATSNTESM
ncbi:hypothetical protein PHYPSEUDO_011016 [Phytophthora pseudosyringae]|uniref:Myb/SANT-like DNA-binding domain-containing protein n=1 Tax=Phytophthora pseudosyringae TaxID=221518 RepID=A0A8T1VCE3_9STRA|nr:hypothetical protein PHYPSEUDO_011016 [Phytophthora pseudosyringae]